MLSYHQKLSGKEIIKNNDSVKKKSEETSKRYVFYFLNPCVTLQGFQWGGGATACAHAGTGPNIGLEVINHTPSDIRYFPQREQCPIQEFTL